MHLLHKQTENRHQDCKTGPVISTFPAIIKPPAGMQTTSTFPALRVSAGNAGMIGAI